MRVLQAGRKDGETMSNEQYILQSVDNALAIIDLLAKHEELSAAEVARLMEIGKTTAFRLLTTLENRKFLNKTDSNRYRLGVKLSSLGAIVLGRMDIIKLAHPYLINLTQLCEETTHLVIWDNDTMVQFIDKVSSPSSIRMESMVGLRRRAHMTATGKAMLAFQPQQFIDNYIKNVSFSPKTPYSIVTAQQLLENLEGVRRNGYACDADESELGLTCYAAPLFGVGDRVEAAISASGPTERMKSKKDFLIPLLQKTAQNIAAEMK